MATWSLETADFDGPYGLVWLPAEAVFVALPFTTDFRKSADGLTYDIFPVPADQTLIGVASNGAGVLVAVSVDVTLLGTGAMSMLRSTDGGETWTLEETPQFTWPDLSVTILYNGNVLWAASLGVFVVSGTTTDNDSFLRQVTFTSPDGVTWTETGQFVAPDNTTYSINGSVLAWSDTLGRLAVQGSTNNELVFWTTDDLANWTLRTPPAGSQSDSVTQLQRSDELGLFFCTVTDVNFSAPRLYNDLLTSPDGITWTLRTMPTVNGVTRDVDDYEWLSVAAIPAPTPYLLAIGVEFSDPPSDTAQFIATSPDGIAWTLEPPTGVIGFSILSIAATGFAVAPALDLLAQALFGPGPLMATDLGMGSPSSSITIDNVSPAVGGLAGGTEVELTGSGFDPDVEVLFDQLFALSVVWNSATSLTVTTPPHAEGVVTVTATNPVSGEFFEGTGLYEYADADSPLGEPEIDLGAGGITPNQGPISGGTAVTILGEGFKQGSIVLFGGTPATSVVVSPGGTQITCVTPAHPVGLVDVQVAG